MIIYNSLNGHDNLSDDYAPWMQEKSDRTDSYGRRFFKRYGTSLDAFESVGGSLYETRKGRDYEISFTEKSLSHTVGHIIRGNVHLSHEGNLSASLRARTFLRRHRIPFTERPALEELRQHLNETLRRLCDEGKTHA